MADKPIQLKHARQYAERLRLRLWELNLAGKLPYITTGWQHIDYGFDNGDNHKKLPVVAVVNNQPKVLFVSTFTRSGHDYCDIETINLTGIPSPVTIFARTVFVDHLFRVQGARALTPGVFHSNPAMDTWANWNTRMGGRYVGFFRDHFQLPDGRHETIHYWEIMREDWFAAIEHGAGRQLYERAMKLCEFHLSDWS